MKVNKRGKRFKKTNSNKKTMLLIILLLAIVLIGGIAAYLTDKDEKVNVMTLGGNVEISLTEVWTPEDGQDILPGTVVTKAPSIQNNSETTPAYVFAEVVVPCYASTGTAVDTPLFIFTANLEWTLINTPSVDTESKTITYVYAYGTSSSMTTLDAETTTSTAVFNQVTLAPTLTDEQKQTANATTNIDINAYGIQVENLGTTSPAEIYEIVNSSVDQGTSEGGENPGDTPTQPSTVVFKNGEETVDTPQVGNDVLIGEEKFRVIKITDNKVTAMPYYNLDLTSTPTKQQKTVDTAYNTEQTVAFSTAPSATWNDDENIILGPTESAITIPIANYENYLVEELGANNVIARIGRYYPVSKGSATITEAEYIGNLGNLNPAMQGDFFLGSSCGSAIWYVRPVSVYGQCDFYPYDLPYSSRGIRPVIIITI